MFLYLLVSTIVCILVNVKVFNTIVKDKNYLIDNRIDIDESNENAVRVGVIVTSCIPLLNIYLLYLSISVLISP